MITESYRVLVDPFGGFPPRLAEALARLYALEAVRGGAGPAGDPEAMLALPGAGELPERGPQRLFDARGAVPGRPGGAAGPVEYADDERVPRTFRGRTVPDADHDAEPLEPKDGERVLAQGSRGPLWLRRELDGRRIDRVAVAPPGLEGELLRDAFRPGRCIGLLPLLEFAAGPGARRPLPATILIDDPNLHRTRYGFLDFAAIAETAQRSPLHVALAMIPLDTWYADRRAVELFSGEHAALSLCVHGNNHVTRELARPLEPSVALAELAQALSRTSRSFRAPLPGPSVSPVMVAPHGACAPATMRRLVRVGFEAISIGHARPWGVDERDRLDVLLGARPVEFYDGLPILLRRHVSEFDDLPFAAFLEQPVILYGHHWDWPDGAAGLAATAAQMAALAELAWTRRFACFPAGPRFG